MKNPFGSKKGKQAVCLMAETNSVKDESLEAGTLHAESLSTVEAWKLNRKQQAKDELTDDYVQFVSSTHLLPVKIYKNQDSNPIKLKPLKEGEKPKKETSLIASQKEDEELVYIDQGGRSKDGRLLWLGISLALLTLTICVIALVAVL